MRSGLLLMCLLLCTAVGIQAHSGENDAPRTIMIMPERCNLIFEDSLTVVGARAAIHNYRNQRIESPGQAMSSADEREFWYNRDVDLTDDAVFRGLLNTFDSAVSRHRGERASAFKAYHTPQISRVVDTLTNNGIKISSFSRLAGIVFVDGNEYDVDRIKRILPGDVIELAEGYENYGPNTNIVTRVTPLHDRGITGGDGNDPDTLAFDYLCVDTGIDTFALDILSGHRIFAKYDAPFPPLGSGSMFKHGTNVSSAVCSYNDTTMGVAPDLDAIFVACNRDSVPLPGVSTTEMEVLGFSWGVGDTDSLYGDTPEVLHCAYGTFYHCEDGYTRFLDSMVDAFDVFLAVTAGNVSTGYPDVYSVANCGHSYNGVTVNALDMPDTNRSNAALYSIENHIWGAWGPTCNGRKKPDLCVPVVSMKLRTYNGGVYESPEPFTSYAAPQVTGAGLLLMDRGVTCQRSIKSLMLNTTYRPSDMNTADWDTGYGWGMLDIEHAVFHADEGDYYESQIFEASGVPIQRHYSGTFLPFDNVQNAYDRATLAWERHANWSYGDTADIAEMDLTDLNLYLYNGTTGALIDSSTSTIDNVEQVYWNELTDTLDVGVLVVSCNGNLPSGYSFEPFSLATEENFTYYNPANDLIGIAIEDSSNSTAEVYCTYSLSYTVSLDGYAECDTLWPSLSRVDANTSIISGPSPSYLVLAQGEHGTITYSLLSSTTGQRNFKFKVLTEGYRSTWFEAISTPVNITGTIFFPAPSPEGCVTEFTLTSVKTDRDKAIFNYSAPAAAEVTLDIYDVRGRRIYVREYDSSSTTGILTWAYRNDNGQRVGSGTYMARISSSDVVVTKKIVVVR